MQVKITDNALARDLFPMDYHCLGDNENRPVRWMALESLLHHDFSSLSDVVTPSRAHTPPAPPRVGCFWHILPWLVSGKGAALPSSCRDPDPGNRLCVRGSRAVGGPAPFCPGSQWHSPVGCAPA